MVYKYKTDAGRQKGKAEKSYKSGMTPEVCKSRMFGRPCSYCRKVELLYSSEDESDHKIAGKCRVRSTYYMNMVDIDKKEDGNQIYGSGIENWRTLIDFLPDDTGEGVDFTNPDGACAVLMMRRGTGPTNTKYSIKLSTKQFKVPSKYLGGMYPLHTVLDLIANDEVTIWIPEAKSTPNRLLILPPWGEEAEGDFYFEVFYHWNVHLLGEEEEGADDEIPLDELGGEGELEELSADEPAVEVADDDEIPF